MKLVYLRLTLTTTVVYVLMVNVCYGGGKNNRSVIEAVSRRTYSDLYFVHPVLNDFGTSCDFQETYMIEDKKCIKNEDVFIAMAVSDAVHDRKSVSRPVLHMTHGRSELILYTHGDEKESVSCHILSLEVVRGLESTFEIDHSGFSLISENGTLKVNEKMLAYILMDYVGELYRIKISCDGNENNYVFVVWGKANVTEPKFNCTIPGTLYNHSIDCPAPDQTITKLDDEQGPAIKQSVAVGIGVGIFAVLFLAMFFSCAIIFICKKKRVKVSAIRSGILESNSSTRNRACDTKSEKDVDNKECIYATPGELVQSNMYGCGDLESNPAYKEPGIIYSGSEEHLKCDDTAIPRHMNPCYDYSISIEEPVYQEIIPRQRLELETSTTVSSSRVDLMNSSVTVAQAVSLYESMEL